MKKIDSSAIKIFTGGPVETHCYLVTLPEGNLLIDAPEGAMAHFQNSSIDMLLLTHAHFDHVMDAANIVKKYHCPVVMHPTTEVLLADKMLFRRLGLNIEVEPVQATAYLKEGPQQILLGAKFDLYEVPGHCPGSICLHDPLAEILYGGDVLFAGGVGRWDLPGGDREILLHGIHQKLLTLPHQTRVFPGHGPETTIGVEALTNPYLNLKTALT